MPAMLSSIAFDADDTLWHNERFFQLTQARFAELLAPYAPDIDLDSCLQAAERRNLGRYGFGIKGFVLSMIETALEVTDQKVPGQIIAELIATGQDMLNHPIELLPYAAEAVASAADHGQVILITKGDLLDQERKLAQSGLGEMFDRVEIVSDKVPETYARIFETDIERSVMVGNSMKSDVRPMIEAGGWGVFVPQSLAWDFEHAEPPEEHPRYRAITDLRDLPSTLAELMP